MDSSESSDEIGNIYFGIYYIKNENEMVRILNLVQKQQQHLNT